ncbi:uncharacterized protein LOC117173146 isoform X2 [Belonocnema kinseyi]|uniref:uncharacterized protein LOC117173146 isoform X2 n=1 Tax=Belonocnema kinseyi TaxID=2817044 RepID=UPI00143D70C7|nr:uncharacterized protein LOC117173146 isoform X2 [Belonocnema kinseyi]
MDIKPEKIQCTCRSAFPNNQVSANESSSNCKRLSYLSWNDYFMSVAVLSSMRSKDPRSQVGACIVNKDKRIVGVGYNGFPVGCSDSEFPWTEDVDDELKSKNIYVCHAEVNAIMNRNSYDLKECTLYVANFPCNECAKVIIQSSITTIFYMSDRDSHNIRIVAAKKMFDAAKVEYRQYVPSSGKFAIDFSKINLNQVNQLPSSPGKSEISSNDNEEVACNCQSPIIKSQIPPICEQFGNALKLSETKFGKRQSYLSWDDYFMAMAFLSAMRSKDPCTQVGACIVNESKVVVSIGYNGFPKGCSDDEFPWSKNVPDKLQSKYLYVPGNRLGTCNLITIARQDFWKRWYKEFLNELQTRQKWQISTSELKLGSVYLLMKNNLGCSKWPLGVIVEVFPGSDDIVGWHQWGRPTASTSAMSSGCVYCQLQDAKQYSF